MTIHTMKIKLFGKIETVYRVLDKAGEVLHVAADKADAEQWIANA